MNRLFFGRTKLKKNPVEPYVSTGLDVVDLFENLDKGQEKH